MKRQREPPSGFMQQGAKDKGKREKESAVHV